MGSMFKKPKAYEPSAKQKELESSQLETQKEQESELAQSQAMRKKRLAGRTSLLTGSATGVERQSTLG